MKKVVVLCVLFFLSINMIYADEKVSVTFDSCVDGDTANFIMNNEKIKVRFLAIDTPETVHPKIGVEPYGKEASDFTCSKIKNASKIELEFDSNSDKLDKYNRYLAWIWVDDYLLQDSLIKEGYAEVAYIYGNYKYVDLLKDHQAIAESKKIGLWSNEINNTITDENNDEEPKNDGVIEYVFYIVGILVVIIACAISSSYRKKVLKKLKLKR